jgi:putative membrane protein
MRHPSISVVAAISLCAFLGTACSKTETTTTSSTETAVTDTYASTATAATDSTATTSTMATPSVALQQADQDFVMKAAQGGLAEVAMGAAGLQKAANADVKAFAQRMVTDHGNANSELTQLASTKGVTLPTDVGAEHKAAADHLGTLSGAEFDKAYMMHMVDDHEKDVKEFETAAQSAQDPELKAWAAKTLRTLKDHLKMAKETQAKLK